MWRYKASITVFFLSLLAWYPVLSQRSELARWDSIVEAKNYRNTLKLSPLHGFDFYPSFQVAYERRLTKRFSMQTDVGFVIERSTNNLRYQNIHGFKLNVEGRFYFIKATYIGMEAYTTAVDFDRQATVNGCFDLDCQMQYSRTYNFGVKYRESGFSWKVGHNIGLFERDHLILDVSYGLDLRFINYIKPIDDTSSSGFFWVSVTKDERKRREVSPAVGFRLGYRFR